MATDRNRMPCLVLTAHGTRDGAGVRVLDEVAAAVADAFPDVDVALSFVDVQEPSVAEVVTRRFLAHRVVVVPLLLSWGYHVEVDILTAVAAHPRAVATRPLGPDPRLAELLDRRLEQAGVSPDRAVVLGVAGSSRPRAAKDAEAVRGWLSARRSAPVVVAYAAARQPTVADAVRTLRDAGEEQVPVATYLLAPGYFLGVLRSAGADLVSEPLGAAREVVAVVQDRYAEGLAMLGWPGGRHA